MFRDFDIFIGLDVDKNSFSFTVRDNYTMKKSKRIPSDANNLYSYIQNNYQDKKVICAYEAGPTGYSLYDDLTKKGIPCLMVSPFSIPKAPNQRVKNNRIDSDKLCQFLKAGELTSIRVPDKIYRELRELATIRENNANDLKRAKQRIKALLLYANLHKFIKDSGSHWSKRYIEQIEKIKSSISIETKLKMLLMDLDYARKQLLSAHKALQSFYSDNKEIKQYIHYLRSIPGIGFVTSTTILAKIGDPKNLKNPRELASFAGLVPREHSTGDTINKGEITRLGSHTLRFMLTEAAWIAIRYDTELKQFYHRIKSRHHPKIGAKKAITAVARKLTQIIYRVLKDQRTYIVH